MTSSARLRPSKSYSPRNAPAPPSSSGAASRHSRCDHQPRRSELSRARWQDTGSPPTRIARIRSPAYSRTDSHSPQMEYGAGGGSRDRTESRQLVTPIPALSASATCSVDFGVAAPPEVCAQCRAACWWEAAEQPPQASARHRHARDRDYRAGRSIARGRHRNRVGDEVFFLAATRTPPGDERDAQTREPVRRVVIAGGGKSAAACARRSSRQPGNIERDPCARRGFRRRCPNHRVERRRRRRRLLSRRIDGVEPSSRCEFRRGEQPRRHARQELGGPKGMA